MESAGVFLDRQGQRRPLLLLEPVGKAGDLGDLARSTKQRHGRDAQYRANAKTGVFGARIWGFSQGFKKALALSLVQGQHAVSGGDQCGGVFGSRRRGANPFPRPGHGAGGNGGFEPRA